MRHLRSWLLAIACVVVVMGTLGPAPATAKSKCRRRIRKPWEAYSEEEKATYLKAVELGMERGYYALFTKVHANKMSSDQAHNTCGFLLWHRRLLLAYENMLRSFGPEFECVTIPVWNVFGAFAMQTQKRCRSAEECSPLLQALGGSKGVDRNLQIESRKFGPNCVENGPVGKYCDGPDMDPEQCTRCIPRGNWASTALPDSLSYSNLMRILSEAKGAKDLNQNIQHSSHDHVHSALKGVMASFYSPLDPIFYSLHTAIDMLHHIYYTCNIAEYLTDDKKISLPKAWETCADANGPDTDATSDIVMQYFVGDKEVEVNVDEHLRPFYKGVPNRFFELVDANDIGKFSYSYSMTTLLTDMIFNPDNAFICTKSNVRRLMAMESFDDPVISDEDPVSGGAGTVQPETETEPEDPIGSSAASAGSGEDNALPDEPLTPKPKAPDAAGEPGDPPLKPTKPAVGAPNLGQANANTTKTPQGRAEQKTTEFYYKALELAKASADNDKEARDLVELMECKIYNETVAPVEDFTEEFRFEFNIPPDKYPRCYELLVVKKEVAIKVPDWRPLAEEELHVTLAKPADPSIPESELDSSRGADIEVTTTEPIITPAPDAPVATPAPVSKEEIAISADTAQTPPPTTPAPPGVTKPTPPPEDGSGVAPPPKDPSLGGGSGSAGDQTVPPGPRGSGAKEPRPTPEAGGSDGLGDDPLAPGSGHGSASGPTLPPKDGEGNETEPDAGLPKPKPGSGKGNGTDPGEPTLKPKPGSGKGNGTDPGEPTLKPKPGSGKGNTTDAGEPQPGGDKGNTTLPIKPKPKPGKGNSTDSGAGKPRPGKKNGTTSGDPDDLILDPEHGASLSGSGSGVVDVQPKPRPTRKPGASSGSSDGGIAAGDPISVPIGRGDRNQTKPGSSKGRGNSTLPSAGGRNETSNKKPKNRRPGSHSGSSSLDGSQAGSEIRVPGNQTRTKKPPKSAVGGSQVGSADAGKRPTPRPKPRPTTEAPAPPEDDEIIDALNSMADHSAASGSGESPEGESEAPHSTSTRPPRLSATTKPPLDTGDGLSVAVKGTGNRPPASPGIVAAAPQKPNKTPSLRPVQTKGIITSSDIFRRSLEALWDLPRRLLRL